MYEQTDCGAKFIRADTNIFIKLNKNSCIYETFRRNILIVTNK